MSDIKDIESKELAIRMRGAVSLAWSVFARKVGGGLITINKEASMQLQYSYILQQVLPLIGFHSGEDVKLELETGVKVADSSCEIDLLVLGNSFDGKYHRIAVEMKCYRTKASSGGNRGATDIFMKDVYEDLATLEN